MSEFVEFLLARIAEDEWIAHSAVVNRVQVDPDVSTEGWVCHDLGTHVGFSPARVLAECEAKRRIVEMHTCSSEHEPGHIPGFFCEVGADWPRETDEGQPPTVPWPCPTLRALALPHADHPDYRDEWRPPLLANEPSLSANEETP